MIVRVDVVLNRTVAGLLLLFLLLLSGTDFSTTCAVVKTLVIDLIGQ